MYSMRPVLATTMNGVDLTLNSSNLIDVDSSTISASSASSPSINSSKLILPNTGMHPPPLYESNVYNNYASNIYNLPIDSSSASPGLINKSKINSASKNSTSNDSIENLTNQQSSNQHMSQPTDDLMLVDLDFLLINNSNRIANSVSNQSNNSINNSDVTSNNVGSSTTLFNLQRPPPLSTPAVLSTFQQHQQHHRDIDENPLLVNNHQTHFNYETNYNNNNQENSHSTNTNVQTLMPSALIPLPNMTSSSPSRSSNSILNIGIGNGNRVNNIVSSTTTTNCCTPSSSSSSSSLAISNNLDSSNNSNHLNTSNVDLSTSDLDSILLDEYCHSLIGRETFYNNLNYTFHSQKISPVRF
jgi:hypothetical protein